MRQAISLDSNAVEAHIIFGDCLYGLEDYEAAITALTRAIQIDPSNAIAYLSRGDAKAEMGNFSGALADYTTAIDQGPSARVLGEIHRVRGDTYLSLGRVDEAREDYSSSIRIDREKAEGWRGLGDVYSFLEQYPDALRHYSRAVSLNSQHAGAWLGLGYTYFRLAQYEKALEHYEKATAINPDLAAAVTGLELAREELGYSVDASEDSGALAEDKRDPRERGDEPGRSSTEVISSRVRTMGRPAMHYLVGLSLGEVITTGFQAGHWVTFALNRAAEII